MKKDISIVGKYLTIRVSRSFDYHVLLRELDNPEKVRWWLDHLSEKSWFSEGMKADMIGLLHRHFAYRLGNIATRGKVS